MDRRSAVKLMGAAAAVAGLGALPGRARAADKITIALVPGLTADGFYVTMHHGAEAAAKAVGADLDLPGRGGMERVAASAGARRGDRQEAGRDHDRADGQGAAHPAAEEGLRRGDRGRLRRHLHRQRACFRPAPATPISRSPTSPPTTCSAAGWRRARSPRRSARRARSMSPTPSPTSRPPTSARRASRRR